MIENTALLPPSARKELTKTQFHGTTLTDEYAWMRDKESPEVTAYLQAENAYAEAVMAPAAGLRDELYREMLSHMKQTDVSVPFRDGVWWYYTRTSAADQARFLFALPRLIPAQFYAYARGLLAGIEPSQSWGVPPVARPRWQVFFKTGALPEEGLFNEVARLERPGVTCTLAVFTDGDPSMSYGEQTIEGVAATLLAHSG